MNPTEEDWSLLHSRARKIERCFPIKSKEDEANAFYWIEMTEQQLKFIKEKLRSKESSSEISQKGVKVF